MDESFIERAMFGCLACYHLGRLKFVLADSEDPWNGVLVATERRWHEKLLHAFPVLRSHPILGKWLYLSADGDGFERTMRELMSLAMRDEESIGVVPKRKRRKPRVAKRATKAKRGRR